MSGTTIYTSVSLRFVRDQEEEKRDSSPKGRKVVVLLYERWYERWYNYCTKKVVVLLYGRWYNYCTKKVVVLLYERWYNYCTKKYNSVDEIVVV